MRLSAESRPAPSASAEKTSLCMVWWFLKKLAEEDRRPTGREFAKYVVVPAVSSVTASTRFVAWPPCSFWWSDHVYSVPPLTDREACPQRWPVWPMAALTFSIPIFFINNLLVSRR